MERFIQFSFTQLSCVSLGRAGVRSSPSGERQPDGVCVWWRAAAIQRWFLSQISTHISVPSPGSPAHINIPSPWPSDVFTIVFTARSQANMWTLGQREWELTMGYEPDSWTQSELMLNVAYVTFLIRQSKDIKNQIVSVPAVIKGF